MKKMKKITELKEILFVRFAVLSILLSSTAMTAAQSTVSVGNISIVAEAEAEVTISISSAATDIWKLEGDIVLPGGLKFKVVDAKAEWSVADISKDKASTLKPSNGHFSVRDMNLPHTGFSAASGSVFRFTVVATSDLPATSTITLTNVVATHLDGKTENIADASNTVTKAGNTTEQVYATLTADLEALQNEYEETADFIKKYCKIVDYSTQFATLQDRITTLKTSLETAKTNNSIDKADFTAKITAISNDIKALRTEAVKKQTDKDGISPELTAIFQNWNIRISAVQQKLKETVESIRTDYPVIVDAMTSEINAVQEKLGKVKSQLDDLYYTQALTASTTFDLASIEKDIAALLTSAKTKNDQAIINTYATLKAEIAALQKQLDDNRANIQKDCDSEVTRVADADAMEIQALITKLQADLEAQNTAGKLKADSKLDTLTKKRIEDGIAAMYFKAIKSQNDKTYAALLQELKALENDLGEARKDIDKKYGKKAAQAVAADLDAIQKMIDEARATLKKQHDNILITKHTTANQAAIQAAIQAALNKAKGAQDNPDTPDAPDNPDTPQPSKETQALYKALTADLTALQRQLDNALAEMERKYDKDIVEATEKDFAELQKMIDEMKAKIEELYKADKLDKNMEIDKDAFTAALNKAKEATKALQAAKNYKAMTAVITELEAELAKAKEEVQKNASDVAREYKLQFTLIEQLLTKLKDQVEKENKEGMVDMNNMASADIIKKSIDQVLADAAKREESFLANKKLTEKLDRTEALLESVIEQIRNDYADVADGFKDEMAKIQQMIDDLRTQLRKQYLNDELDENSDIDVTAIRQAITALMKAVQEAHTVGISSVTMPEGATTEIYDLSGQRINQLKKGTVVIVRMQDGRLRKMSVR